MKVLIAPDKFKGSLSALEVGKAIARGIQTVDPAVECHIQPLADGGEGSLTVWDTFTDGEFVTKEVEDPLRRPVNAAYLLVGKTAYVEMAAASGLVLVPEELRNPLDTCTIGTGQLIKDAIEKGAKEIVLFLGGSATNDGGMGIAYALGFQFKDAEGQLIVPKGKNLGTISRIVPPPDFIRQGIKISCLSDVQNPFVGSEGATMIYAPQKGADAAALAILEKGMKHLASLINRQYGVDIANIPGGGAAGGIAGGLNGLLGAEIKSGIEMMLTISDMEAKVKSADLVISGEGKLDHQTLTGKVIHGLSQLSQKHQKPLWLFVGQHELGEKNMQELGIDQLFSVIDNAENIAEAMSQTAKILEKISYEAFSQWREKREH